MQAAAMLVERRGDASPSMLIGALDGEKDEEVRASFYQALGQFATPEAVETLIAAAQPERGLFRRKPAALRIAAIQALAMAGTPQALDALVAFQGDRDGEVQQAAVEALEKKVREAGNDRDIGRSGGPNVSDRPTF
jgi:HEAT repeat protein